jgi:hypothetical protein
MDAGAMDPGGRGLTNAGKIYGIVGTILLIIGAVIFGIAFTPGFAAALAHRP